MSNIDRLSPRQRAKYFRHNAHVRVIQHEGAVVVAFRDTTRNAAPSPLRWTK